MGFQQMQFQCPQCNEPTLHTRHVRDIPHLIHAIVTVFLCGFWLPIWLLDIITDKSGSVPFLCQRCGCNSGMHYYNLQRAQQQAAIAATPPILPPVPAGHCRVCRVPGKLYEANGGIVMFCPNCRERVE